jgi:hypothetical protein
MVEKLNKDSNVCIPADALASSSPSVRILTKCPTISTVFASATANMQKTSSAISLPEASGP